jgi:large subunit ribosomal protein L28
MFLARCRPDGAGPFRITGYLRGGFGLLNAFSRYLQSLFKKGQNSRDMARVCQITGKRPQVGNNVSHANNKTKRRFYPNLQTKRFFIPEENKWITLKVSTKAIKTINAKGITAVLKEAREKGTLAI